jgi:hypothetical protein
LTPRRFFSKAALKRTSKIKSLAEIFQRGVGANGQTSVSRKKYDVRNDPHHDQNSVKEEADQFNILSRVQYALPNLILINGKNTFTVSNAEAVDLPTNVDEQDYGSEGKHPLSHILLQVAATAIVRLGRLMSV